jgi:ubiquinone/menaquinone biosynthesis C-methylase UbiE
MNSTVTHKSEEQSARSYDSVSSVYDRIIVPHFFELPGKDLAALLDLAPGNRVLDVGTGTGSAALPALMSVGSEGTVIALDPSLKMLQVAKMKGIHHVIGGKVPGIPFTDSVFDGVMANFVLSHFKDYESALSDMVRVIRGGGRMSVSVWRTSQTEFIEVWSEVAESFIDMERLQESLQKGLPWEEWFTDENNLVTALEKANLENIHVNHSEYRVSISVKDYLTIRESGMRGRYLKELLGDEKWDQFREQVAEEFQKRYSESLEYDNPAYMAVGSKVV